MTIKTSNWGIAVLLFSFMLSACQREETVSFARHVQPTLERHCIDCHQPGGAGYEASEFSMTSYDALMKGTKYGPMIIPEDPEGSNMVVLMEGRADPSISMPHGNLDPVPREDIQTIRKWIEQGAENN
ncbi:MAG: c-type cytochrome domain-containing protein [Xanthomonadales bacterium]|nr:c-type cytochrome domain-containing protein [Xanthomonadales bacterium]